MVQNQCPKIISDSVVVILPPKQDYRPVPLNFPLSEKFYQSLPEPNWFKFHPVLYVVNGVLTGPSYSRFTKVFTDPSLLGYSLMDLTEVNPKPRGSVVNHTTTG